MASALGRFRVLDLSRILAGPFCTMILGDLGAEVIKVERPGAGDDTRRWGPPFVAGESAYFLCINRNKKSVTVNFKSAEGREIVRRLAALSDVVVENFKVGELGALGLGYEDLRRVNPRLVYCSITGYGQSGPDKDLPGYDFMIQGRGGVMSVTGEPDGDPMKVGVAISDVTAGLFACIAIQAALLSREATGQGQYIDISLLDSQVAWLINVASNYLVSGQVPRRYGNAHPNIAPYHLFKASDGCFTAGTGNEAQWQRLCRDVLDRPDLADDPRFSTNAGRVKHREALVSALQEAFLKRSVDEWLARLNAAQIPCGPVQTVDQVLADAQVLARRMLCEVEHPAAGRLSLVASPLKLSATPPAPPSAPPLLGEHTEEVLCRLLDYSVEDVARLRENGVV
jgi:formyl-CoA transferase